MSLVKFVPCGSSMHHFDFHLHKLLLLLFLQVDFTLNSHLQVFFCFILKFSSLFFVLGSKEHIMGLHFIAKLIIDYTFTSIPLNKLEGASHSAFAYDSSFKWKDWTWNPMGIILPIIHRHQQSTSLDARLYKMF